jgi:hypothetical protein
MLVKTKSRMIVAMAAILLSTLVAIPARAADSVTVKTEVLQL